MTATPVPTRDELLAFIRESDRHMDKRDLARAFKLKGQARIDLKELLRQLEDEGVLERGRGSIVNVGALSAQSGQPNMGAYVAAKSTVMRLTESLSGELRSQGVNVNAVLPSMIDTPTNRRDMPDADFSRWVDPADLAEVMCFLASDAARAVHGALVPVRGLS